VSWPGKNAAETALGEASQLVRVLCVGSARVVTTLCQPVANGGHRLGRTSRLAVAGDGLPSGGSLGIQAIRPLLLITVFGCGSGTGAAATAGPLARALVRLWPRPKSASAFRPAGPPASTIASGRAGQGLSRRGGLQATGLCCGPFGSAKPGCAQLRRVSFPAGCGRCGGHLACNPHLAGSPCAAPAPWRRRPAAAGGDRLLWSGCCRLELLSRLIARHSLLDLGIHPLTPTAVIGRQRTASAIAAPAAAHLPPGAAGHEHPAWRARKRQATCAALLAPHASSPPAGALGRGRRGWCR